MKNLYIGYCRVSTTKQLDGGGIDRQRQKIDRFVKMQGCEVAYWYEDDISGTKESRPSLDMMLLDLNDLKHTAENVHIVVERNDRLARNLVVQELTLHKFSEAGVSCFSAETGIDMSVETPDNKFLRQIMGAAAEFDKDMTLAKLRAGRESLRARLIAAGKKGKVEGRKGYEELLPAVYEDCLWLYTHGKREMHTLSSDQQFGYTKIAKVLEDMGYMSLRGTRITRKTVETILRTAGVIQNE